MYSTLCWPRENAINGCLGRLADKKTLHQFYGAGASLY